MHTSVIRYDLSSTLYNYFYEEHYIESRILCFKCQQISKTPAQQFSFKLRSRQTGRDSTTRRDFLVFES